MAQYLDNAKFLAAIKERKIQCSIALSQEQPKPQISAYLSQCIVDIATHIGYRPNFSSYSYLDEMRLDGIENSIKYFDKFDPDNYSNPYGYFSKIIWQAFLRRIDKEKEQAYIKHKLVVDMSADGFVTQGHDTEHAEEFAAMQAYLQEHSTFDSSFLEKRKNKNKPKAVVAKLPSPLDEFI